MENDKYIRFDWAMKRMLRHKANFDVLEGLLQVLLGEKISIIELLESEGNQLEENDKYNRVDIKAKDSKDEIIIIEIQNTRERNFLERILYGVASAITEHMELGESYSKVKKVISISILYFDLGKGADYLYHGQNRFVGVHTRDELQVTERQRNALGMKTPQEVFPDYYLIRVNEFNKVATTPLEEWIEYLKTGRISDDATAPGLPEAREKLKYYNMSRAEQIAYRAHINNQVIEDDVIATKRLEQIYDAKQEGIALGLERGIEQGREEGEQAKAEGIARNLKTMGMTAEQIAEATGLSVTQIESL